MVSIIEKVKILIILLFINYNPRLNPSILKLSPLNIFLVSESIVVALIGPLLFERPALSTAQI